MPLVNMRSAEASLAFIAGLFLAKHDSTVASNCSRALETGSHGVLGAEKLPELFRLVLAAIVEEVLVKLSGIIFCKSNKTT